MKPEDLINTLTTSEVIEVERHYYELKNKGYLPEGNEELVLTAMLLKKAREVAASAKS